MIKKNLKDEFFVEDRERTGNSNYGIDEYIKERIERIEKNKKRKIRLEKEVPHSNLFILKNKYFMKLF